jgi:predicted O-methyltransferase YrrM
MNLAQKAIEAGSHIFTWTSVPEMTWLADRASQAQVVVEIGSYMGRTAKLFAVACPGKVYCVDHFETAGVQRVFEHFLQAEMHSGKVALVVANSQDGATQLSGQLRGKVDMVFIDDGHAYNDVVRDIKSWLPLMRPGGLVCGHDFEVNSGKFNEVARAVMDMLPYAKRQVGSIWSCAAK